MEQSNTQSSFVRILLKVARFIGIYLLSLVIVYFLGKNGVFAMNHHKTSPIVFLSFFLGLLVIAPLVWALSKNFLKGFVRFALLIGVLLVVDRMSQKNDDLNIVSDSSTQGSFSYVGSYSTDENGVQVKIVISPNKWYGEVIEGTTGGLISNEGGDVNDMTLYDEYGNEIGEIHSGEIIATIKGQRVRLTKD